MRIHPTWEALPKEEGDGTVAAPLKPEALTVGGKTAEAKRIMREENEIGLERKRAAAKVKSEMKRAAAKAKSEMKATAKRLAESVTEKKKVEPI